MKTILLSGFEPFGGASVNASEQIVRQLDGRRLAGHVIHGIVLPCEFRRAPDVLRKGLQKTRPAWVVCLGQAAGRREIAVERIAHNLDDAVIPDNAGEQPVDRSIIRSGAAAYWSTLPVRAIVAAVSQQRIPVALSMSAGGFVCNHVFYALMHALRSRRGVRGGFIHVPAMPSPTETHPCLELETCVRGVEIALETCVRTDGPVRDSAGGGSAK